MPTIPRRHLPLPAPGTRRAVVIGAGSFGTAVAVLLARGGLRTTLQTRSAEQAEIEGADAERPETLIASGLKKDLAEAKVPAVKAAAKRTGTAADGGNARCIHRDSDGTHHVMIGEPKRETNQTCHGALF